MRAARRCFAHASSLKKYRPEPAAATKGPNPDLRYPRRHPVHMTSPIAEVISYRIPNRPLTPLYSVPVQAQYALFPSFSPPDHSKVANVAVLGPPNAGKSMLVNGLVGAKVAIVSRKINSTQRNLLAIKNVGEVQIVFKDTPGIISTHGEKTNRLSTLGWQQITDCQKSLFVVDAVKRLQNDVCAAASRLQTLLEPHGATSEVTEARLEGESEAQRDARAKKLRARIPAALVVNKCDLVEDRRRVRWLVSELREYANFEQVFFTSAETNYGLPKLLDYLKDCAIPQLWQYHPGQQSNLSDTEKVEEVMREYMLDRLHDEIPYQVVTRTVGWTPYLDGTLRIDQDVYVKSEVQKGILLGKEGHGIERMKIEVQTALVKMYQRPINLVLTVKIMKQSLKQAVNRSEDISHFKHYQPVPRLELDAANPSKQIKQ